jgi:protein-L-isoaspartate O-methyltransferase
MQTPEPVAPDLAEALIRVPRHEFVPARAWALPSASAKGHWIDRDQDPETWWRAVCSDTMVYTQLDGGCTELTAQNAARTYAPTSSASSPRLVVAFLRSLAPARGDRVLDVGTGTGWTAGLCAHLAGDDRVTTVELHPGLAASASANLARCGVHPRVVTADGALGAPDAAPFDRVHVTCGVTRVPYAWVAQTRPGGVIVLPYNPPVGRLLRLTVADGGGAATGRFGAECSYTPLRSPRLRPDPGPAPSAGGTIADADAGDRLDACDRLDAGDWLDAGDRFADAVTAGPRIRALEADPEPLLHPEPGLQVLLTALVGDDPWLTPEGSVVLAGGASRAVVQDGKVTQTGPRHLWDEAEHLHRAWAAHGRPGLDRLGFTVTRRRQYVWLDDPAVPAARLLGGVGGGKQGIGREGGSGG